MKSQKPSKPQKKSNLQLIIVAVVVVCIAIAAVLWKGDANESDINSGNAASNDSDAEVSNNTDEVSNGDADTSGSDNTDVSNSKEIQVIEAGESLVIPLDEVTETAEFYPIEVDGTEMEVIAIRDSDGNVRTAFNTCQVCYSSGRGYYVQKGDYLVCQNCGNPFTADEVEVDAGGCNPYPIFAENKTVTDDSIEISYDFLKETSGIFANWKN